jgi:hypothetical protein
MDGTMNVVDAAVLVMLAAIASSMLLSVILARARGEDE